ncbi:hypothetical protein BDZ85DRAFT_263284, partial [Elsinoe ampelina]
MVDVLFQKSHRTLTFPGPRDYRLAAIFVSGFWAIGGLVNSAERVMLVPLFSHLFMYEARVYV